MIILENDGRGYSVSVEQLDNGRWYTAGCRNFSFAGAQEHWGNAITETETMLKEYDADSSHRENCPDCAALRKAVEARKKILEAIKAHEESCA